MDYAGGEYLVGSFISLMGIFAIFSLAFLIANIAGRWTVFEKAGEAGWAALIPFYSDYILFKISYGEGWMFITRFIPCLNIVFSILVYSRLAKRFGIESDWYVVGLFLLNCVFMLVIGLSKEYSYMPFDSSAEKVNCDFHNS